MSNPVYLSIFIAWRIIIKTKLSIMLGFYTFNFCINKITDISKIQLVVYHQCCVLIG